MRKSIKLVPMCYEFHTRNSAIEWRPTSKLIGYVEREGDAEKPWMLYFEHGEKSGTAYETMELALAALLVRLNLRPGQVRKPVPARYSVEEGSKPVGWLESYSPDSWEWTLYEDAAEHNELCPSERAALKQLTRRLHDLRGAPKITA